MVRRKSDNRTVILTCLLIVIVAALLVLKGDIHFLRLSVLNVPAEGVSYDFDDNTFQGWTVTSPYITVENGRVKAGAAGEGSGSTTVYTYNFDLDFEGWEKYSFLDASAKVTWNISIQDQAARFYCKSLAWSGGNMIAFKGFIYKEFDFSNAESVTAKLLYQSSQAYQKASSAGAGKSKIKAYLSVNGRQGDFIKEWIIPDSVWTTTTIDLSDLAGKKVFLYIGIEMTSCGDLLERELLIDQLEITVVSQPFTTEGYLEKQFSFTKGFETATIKAINLQVDYASEAEWTGFWGVNILESGIETASFQFTKGYMAWNTFTQDIKQYVAGKTVTIRIGGVIKAQPDGI